MIRRPPRSPLFPTRRSSDLAFSCLLTASLCSRLRDRHHWSIWSRLESPSPSKSFWETARGRSEEHTSELQSRQYLVCRLLLEKKKIKYDTYSFFKFKNNPLE